MDIEKYASTSTDLQCDRSCSENFIASGGFADVYVGLLNGTIPVAVKYKRPLRKSSVDETDYYDTRNDEDYKCPFLHEAQFMAELVECDFIISIRAVQLGPVGLECNMIAMELAVCTLCDILYCHNDADGKAVECISNIQSCQSSSVNKVLPLQTKLTLMHDAIKAVEYMHGKLISHNDIKADNFLLTADGKLKLTDFGLSSHQAVNPPHTKSPKLSPTKREKKMLQTTKVAVVSKPPVKKYSIPASTDSCYDLASLSPLPSILRKGSPVYQAPELFTAPAICTFASDVYAFSVLLNEVLTGCRPMQHMLAAMLPVQVCGGLRPDPVYGDLPSSTMAQHVFEKVEESVRKITAENNEETAKECIPARPCEDSETQKRLRHLIKIGWSTSPKERPLSSSVSKTLAKLLSAAGGENRDELERIASVIKALKT